jgi:hypothetical protein
MLVCSWKQFVLLLLETTCLGLKGNMQNAKMLCCTGNYLFKFRMLEV